MSNPDFYISNIVIEGFKSIKKLEVGLRKDINILIGINGSGKTNFLEFINDYANLNIGRLLKRTRLGNLSYSITRLSDSADQFNKVTMNVKPSQIVKSKKEDELKPVKIETSFYLDKRLVKKFNIDMRRLESEKELLDMRKYLRRMKSFHVFVKYIFNYDASLLTRPVSYSFNKKNREINIVEEFEGDMRFLKQVDDYLFFELDDRFEELLAKIKKNDLFKDDEIEQEVINIIYEGFNSIFDDQLLENLRRYSPISEFRFSDAFNVRNYDDAILINNLILEFKVNNEWVPWSYLSDGTKRLFYLIGEVTNFKHGTVFVDEPELGIHPHQLFRIMDFLKNQSFYKQIIISTHSPQVLNCLNPDELDGILITRMTENGTKIDELSKAEVKKAKQYMKEVGHLSDYWINSTLEELTEDYD